MSRTAGESLKELDLDRHQALIVAHGDCEHAHVHVIVNRVDPESGKAPGLVRGHVEALKEGGRLRAEAGSR